MYVVTDLTRFAAGKPNVCTALLDMDSGVCVRPMPYFSYELMKKYNVLPGAVFSGEFMPVPEVRAPHVEDCHFSGLKHHGPASKSDFRNALLKTTTESVVAGFGASAAGGVKVIPLHSPPERSLITLQVSPESVSIVADAYNEQKIKVNFSDASGVSYRFMPITDLGFFDHAKSHRDQGSLDSLNAQIQEATEVFLRVGLSRSHKAPDGREGWWVQVNGLYTFPKKIDVVRGYND